jgi:hypothetical protein
MARSPAGEPGYELVKCRPKYGGRDRAAALVDLATRENVRLKLLEDKSDCSYETGGVIDFLPNLLNARIDAAEILFVVFEMLFDLCNQNIELAF